MSLLPGTESGRGAADRAAAARQRARFARDIGDEAGQAWAHEPRRRPRKMTIGTFVVLVLFAGLGAIPLLTNDGVGGLLRPNCTTPGVAVGPERVRPAESFAWQAAGPDSGKYVVAEDAATVTVDPIGRAQAPGGRVLAGPTAFSGCRSRQVVATAPETTGTHEVTLFRQSGTGWEPVAVALLRVS